MPAELVYEVSFDDSEMREALSTQRLQHIYRDIASRYEVQHALITARADHKGRRVLVDRCVEVGDDVLDCGCGTGLTGMIAAERVGADGHVTFFDLSPDMLAVARGKVEREGLQGRVSFDTGDMVHLPFEDGHFDVVLSTYSLCPVYDPAAAARELYRVTRPGGLLGVGHSAEPEGAAMRRLADWVEDVAWRFPWLSMGCRAVEVLPGLVEAGGRVVLSRRIGVPLWPFLVFVVEKPARSA